MIDGISRGSAEAFHQLVDRFGGRLKAFAAKRLSGSGIDPEDAVQETFLSLVRNLGALKDIRSLQAYLFTILRCRIADLARARGPTAGAVPLGGIDESSPGVAPPSPISTPSTYARQGEALSVRREILADVLEEYLERLKNERKFRDLKVLELIFSKGTSHQDAARIAETSEPTVSRTRKAGVETMRRFVERHPKSDALLDLTWGDDVSALLSGLWEENAFTCIKRSTLGSYALEVLDEDWSDYTRFHLEVIECEYCSAHLDDVLAKDADAISPQVRERIFASSIGFLK